MATHTYSIPKRPPSPAEESQSFLRRGLGAFLEKPSVMVVLGVCIFAVIAVAVAFIQREIFPEYIVTVQQFEISPEISSRLAISGKGAADIVIDMLNRTATDGSRFHGAEYYAYDHHGTQPIALNHAIKIPVQSSYGIELKGISIDSLMKLHDRIRYREWIISGDIFSSGDGLRARIRLNREDGAQSWQTAAMEHVGLAELIQNATSLMLTDVHPELLGRAYMTQEQYPEAAEVFRQWALHAPSDWKPYYYLSLANDYQGKEPEATSLARWSQEIAKHEKSTGIEKPVKTSATDSEIAAELAEITQTVWATREVASADALSVPEKRKQMEKLQDAEQKLERLCANNHASLTCQIQRARILDREATIEADQRSLLDDALKKQNQAIALVTAIIQKMPDNGGLHEQHAMLLQDLVAMEKRGGTAPQAIAETEEEEVAEFTRALELRPTQISPLWGVLYGLIDLKRDEDAVDLTRTITLLQPESTAANAAYVVALEHTMKESSRDVEREAEVTAHLKPLLQSASNSELQALWYGFQDQHDSRNMVKLAAAWKRRFPKDPIFKDPVFKKNVSAALAKAPDDQRFIALRDDKHPLKIGKGDGR